MRIGLGATLLARGLAHQQLDGIGHYTQELAQHLNAVGCEWRPMVFGATPLTHINQRPIDGLSAYNTTALFSAMTGAGFAGHRKLQGQIDLFHATDHHIPKLPGTPVLATLMDAIPLSHPEWANPRMRSLKNQLWLRAARWADHIVTISDFAKSQIIEHFGIAAHHISVVPLGVDQRFFERLTPGALQQVRHQFQLPRPYFLCLGTLQPRKNIHRVIDAYQSLPPQLRQTHDLVIVGRNGWGSEALVQRLHSLQSPHHSQAPNQAPNQAPSHAPSHAHSQTSAAGVRWLGSITDLDKRALLQSATALVFPSLSEGFGLPVLEAFASQTPVITANTTSLPEIAADAAVLIDPCDTQAMAHAMQHLADHPSHAAQLRCQGLTRSRHYTWQTCAQQTAAIYRRMLGRTP